jgi:hypothetical protein
MTDLKNVLALLENGEITGEQTVVIDAALSRADSAEIPDAHVKNVTDFIEIHLLHNNVSKEIRSALDFLQRQLRSRQAD